MGSLDFGKLTTIALVFFIVSYFFGPEIKYWYDHQDDLQFSLNNLSYTQDHYNKLETSEQQRILDDIASLCVRKRYADELDCSETAYWLGHSLEDEGVELDLTMLLMETCKVACETRKAPPKIEDRPEKRKNF